MKDLPSHRQGPLFSKREEAIDHIPPPPTSTRGAKGKSKEGKRRRVRGEGHPFEAVGVRWERVGEKEWESVDGFAG